MLGLVAPQQHPDKTGGARPHTTSTGTSAKAAAEAAREDANAFMIGARVRVPTGSAAGSGGGGAGSEVSDAAPHQKKRLFLPMARKNASSLPAFEPITTTAAQAPVTVKATTALTKKVKPNPDADLDDEFAFAVEESVRSQRRAGSRATPKAHLGPALKPCTGTQSDDDGAMPFEEEDNGAMM